MKINLSREKINWDNVLPKVTASIILALFINQTRSIIALYNFQTWYITLKLPFIAISLKNMEIIWPIVFLLVGIAFYSLWVKGFHIKYVKNALTYLIAAYMLTLISSYIFFWLQLTLVAFLSEIALIFTVIMAMNYTNRVTAKSKWLIAPFLIWTIYLAILYLGIFILNGG